MTEKDDMDFPDDIDVGDDLQDKAGARQNLKEIWQSNPMLKVGAAVAGLAVVIGVIVSVSKSDPVEETQSMVRGSNIKVQVTPGEGGLDEEYKEAAKKENEQSLQRAAATGGSQMPVPLEGVEQGGLEITKQANVADRDPLKEWKETVEQASRMQNTTVVEDDVVGPAPEVVPMAQPVRPQVVAKLDPKVVQALSTQMRTIIGTQTPDKAKDMIVTKLPSEFEVQRRRQEELEKKAQAAANSPSVTKVGYNADGQAVRLDERVILPAGNIFYAQLMTELNSDVPGPALAMVLSGPFRGGRALGEMKEDEDLIVIKFKQIVKDDVVYKIDAIALDEKTTLPATRTSIDHHYISRVVLPAAAEFVSSFSSALAETGTTTTTTGGGGVAAETPEPSVRESLYAGMESATDTITGFMKDEAPDGPTVHVARGTTMGVLLLESIKTGDAE